MASTTPTPQPPKLSQDQLRSLAKDTYIGVYIGTLVSLVFQGYVMSLMYTYLQSPTPTHTPKPRPRPRPEPPLILLLFLTTLFLSSLDMYQVYEIGIPHFTDTSYVFELRWMEGVGVVGNGAVVGVVQGVFGGRLVRLMGLKWWSGLPIYMFITAGLVSSIGTGIKLLTLDRHDPQVFRTNLLPWVYSRYAIGSIIGLFLSIVTIVVLHRKSRGLMTRSVTTFEKIAFYSVHGMVLPTFTYILSLILRAASPRSTLHDFPMHCLGKASLLVLLQMLLARDQTRPDMRPQPDPIESGPNGSKSFSSSGGSGSGSGGGGTHSYPSIPAARVNTSEKRLTLGDSVHGDEADHDDDDELYKTPSRRTDLDSLEAGHFHEGLDRTGLRYDDRVVDIARPSEAHRY